MNEVSDSLDRLRDFFRLNPRFALAFSGGTDSAFLLHASRMFGADVHCYIVHTRFQPDFEVREALQIEKDATVIRASILDNEVICSNDPLRCYHCKTQVFSLIKQYAAADGLDMVCDGTNASDDVDDRPGMKALKELGIRSPLRECGLTKTEIRRLSSLYGLSTADKPSYSCLATRIPTGTRITSEALDKIEKGEEYLFSLGFSDFRLRLRDTYFSLELIPSQTEKAKSMERELREHLGPLEFALRVERKSTDE